jgi:hypothetical protein
MARLKQGTARIALVRADRHRARVVSSGRYHTLPSVRSGGYPREPDRAAPVLVPSGRMPGRMPSAAPWL